MSQMAEVLLKKYYGNKLHPYRIFENQVDSFLTNTTVLLDAGCGRAAPVLHKFMGPERRLIGVELTEFVDAPDGIEYIHADLASIPLPSESVDLIMSRSVFEHLLDPQAVYKEFARLLKKDGRVVFLTANRWDYASLAAQIIPNKYHARIVSYLEGRAEEDVFPTAYRTNTRSTVNQFATDANLQVEEFSYLSQYPNYFMFSGTLFFLAMCYEKVISRFGALAPLRGWILVTLKKV